MRLIRVCCLCFVLGACFGDQQIETTWTIERLEMGEVGCPTDWATAVFVTADANDPDVQTTDRFACNDGHARSSPLPHGTYAAWFEFRDRNDRLVATSISQNLEVESLNSPLRARVFLDAGYVLLSWSWPNKRNCSEGVYNPFEDVHLTLNGPTSFTQEFRCRDERAYTLPLLPGTYSGWFGQGFSYHRFPDITVGTPNRVTELAVML